VAESKAQKRAEVKEEVDRLRRQTISQVRINITIMVCTMQTVVSV
jgi:hypothetical protein